MEHAFLARAFDVFGHEPFGTRAVALFEGADPVDTG
jgi:hypothetical protein